MVVMTGPQSFESHYLCSDIIPIWILATSSHLWPVIVPHNYTNSICHLQCRFPPKLMRNLARKVSNHWGKSSPFYTLPQPFSARAMLALYIFPNPHYASYASLSLHIHTTFLIHVPHSTLTRAPWPSLHLASLHTHLLFSPAEQLLTCLLAWDWKLPTGFYTDFVGRQQEIALLNNPGNCLTTATRTAGLPLLSNAVALYNHILSQRKFWFQVVIK